MKNFGMTLMVLVLGVASCAPSTEYDGLYFEAEDRETLDRVDNGVIGCCSIEDYRFAPEVRGSFQATGASGRIGRRVELRESANADAVMMLADAVRAAGGVSVELLYKGEPWPDCRAEPDCDLVD